MNVLTIRRRRVDPETVAAIATARAAEARAEIERARAMAELRREQAAADRAAALEAERDARQAKRERAAERARVRAEQRDKVRAKAAKLRPVVPLLIINGGAVYAQAAYAYYEVAPAPWNAPSRLAFSVMFAAALESIAVYVQWHAHDALLLKSYSTAAKLRRASWAIAGVVAGINYAHFDDGGQPTPAAVSFGLLSLLSPWLWGLHTRRVQHVQLIAEDPSLVDSSGAVFSPERRRAFPIRSYMAKRWSIDHGVRDPRAAWAGYNRERDARRGRRRPPQPVDDLDQNTRTMLEIIRLQARRARHAVTAGIPTRPRTSAPRPPADRQPASAVAPVPVPASEVPAASTPQPVRTARAETTRTGTPAKPRTGTAGKTRTDKKTGTPAKGRTDTELLEALAAVPREPDGTVPVRRAVAALGTGPDRARRLLGAAGLLRTEPATIPDPALVNGRVPHLTSTT